MSSYHQIFIQTSNSEDQLVADIVAAAGCRMRKLETMDAPIAYTGRTRRVAVEVKLNHDLEDDLGTNFSQYPIVITLRSLDSDKSHEEGVAKEIFNNLAGGGQYAMILTFNLYNVLAEQPPTEKRQST
ncbi:hypothetical protein [Actinomadura formosensis]|uniref:hypothetical protein n=1 Tax=Actinomadura formosensis TaxID=60706 RepID=UPI000834A25F|nr:hypothetical protein [Actinomadura formosensis]